MIALTDTIVGANAGRSRGHNRQVVLGRIQSAGQIGRAEIARASGLSTQAVSNIIVDLIDDGLIVEGGTRSGARGLPVVLYSLNPEGGYAAGVEIRPDAVFAALLNFCGEPIARLRRRRKTRDRAGVTKAVQQMKDALLKSSGVDPARLLGMGIVMPGPFGDTGIKGGASELSVWDDVRPDIWLTDALGLPVVVENDANAAAVAERVSGAAQGLDTYAYLYFGRGLGLGIVHKGRLMAGAFGNAGEIGSVRVPAGQKMVRLEDAVSRMSIARALDKAGVVANDVDDLSSLFDDGNPALMNWLEAAAQPLAGAVAIVENLFDPQTVILGGAMPDNILNQLVNRAALHERSVSNLPDRALPRLMPGSSGRMTATLGAAALVVNHAFTPMIAAQP